MFNVVELGDVAFVIAGGRLGTREKEMRFYPVTAHLCVIPVVRKAAFNK